MRFVATAIAVASVLACSPTPRDDGGGTARSATASARREIRLERTACFHGCPEYNVTVSDDGAVRFRGLSNVAQTGVHMATIPADRAASLFHLVDSLRLDTLAGSYVFGTRGCDPYIADLPGVIVTIVGPQAGWRVEGDPGCPSMPEALLDVAGTIDRVAGTGKWVGR